MPPETSDFNWPDQYDLPDYRAVLPAVEDNQEGAAPTRSHPRFSVKCPAQVAFTTPDGKEEIPILVVEVSRYGFRARSDKNLPLNTWFDTTIKLGSSDTSHVRSQALRAHDYGQNGFYGFSLGEPDIIWQKFVSALYKSKIYSDLESATRFLH